MFRILRNLFALLFLLSNAYIIASVEAKATANAAAKTSTPLNLAEVNVENKSSTEISTLNPIDGVWEIRNPHSKKCIGVGNKHHGLHGFRGLALEKCGVSKITQWRKIQLAHGQFKLINVQTGYSFDFINGGKHNGVRIVLQFWHGGLHQNLTLRKKGNAFQIVAKHSGKCVDIAQGNKIGAIIHQWQCHHGWNQLWTFVKPARTRTYPVPRNQPADRIYEIKNPHSGKCIGIGGKFHGFQSLDLQECGISKMTKWRKVQIAHGQFKLISVANGYVWDFFGGRRHNGVRIVTQFWHGGHNQNLILRKRGNQYQIIAKHSNKCVDIAGMRRNVGAVIHQWSCHNHWNQRWIFSTDVLRRATVVPRNQPANGVYEIKSNGANKCIGIGGIYRGYRSITLQKCGVSKITQWRKQVIRGQNFKLINEATGFVWDVYGGRRHHGSRIVMQYWHRGLNQNWTLRKHGNQYQIISKISNKCVDIARARKNIGAIIHIWGCHHGWNQKWAFVRPRARARPRPRVNPIKPTLKDVYEIRSKVAGKCIGLAPGKYRGFKSLALQKCGVSKSTQWRKKKWGHNHDQYKFINLSNGYVWDVYTVSKRRGTRIILQYSHHMLNQRFGLRKKGRNEYQIVAKHSNQCIEIGGFRRNVGATINQWSCHHGWNQRWTFVRPRARATPIKTPPKKTLKDGIYEIKSNVANKCIGFEANKSFRGYGKTVLHYCGVSKLTQWRKAQVDKNRFRLTNVATGYVWDAWIHHKVVAQFWHNNDNEKFAIKRNGKSQFRILAKNSSKCVEIHGARKHIGATVGTWKCHGGWSQKWSFIKPTQDKPYPVQRNQLADGIYEIKSNGANKCIGVGHHHHRYQSLATHHCGISKATQWRHKQVDNNRFVLINVLNGYVWESSSHRRFILNYYTGNYNQRLSLRKKGHEYQIINNHNMCIDIAHYRKQVATHIVFWRCHNGWNQRFSFVKPAQEKKTYPVPRNQPADGIYEIKNPHSKKCIGMGGDFHQFKQTFLQECGTSKITQWRKTQTANGQFKLINVQTGFAWTSWHNRIVDQFWHGSNNQFFRLRKKGNAFQIVAKNNHKCADIGQGNRIASLVYLHNCHNGWNQLWNFVQPALIQHVPRNPSNLCVIIYEHCNYKGLAKHICGYKKLASLGRFNKKISSVKIGKDAYIILASSKNLKGRWKIISRNDSCLVNDRWNDRAQSLMVSKETRRTIGPIITNPCPVESLPTNPSNGCIIIYQDCNYKGLAQHICGPKNLASLSVLNKRISSIKIGKDAKVTLYGSKNFKGCSKSYRRNDSCLVSDKWNDKAQSLRVSKTVSGPIDGVWEIKSKGAGKCIGASKTNKYKGLPQLELQHCSESINTQWRKSKVSHGRYRFINMGTGYVWDVSQGNKNNYARFSSRKWNGKKSQQFTLRKKGNDYQIIAKHSNKCVDIIGAWKHYGAPIHQWTCHNGWNQRWSFVKYKPYEIRKDNTIYEITSPHFKKCVGLYMYRGRRSLYLKECGINKETQWRLHQVRRGQFKIINVAFNLYLDIYGNSKHNGARAILHKWHGGNNQHFRKISHNRIQAVHSGRCLDTHGGTYLQQWACHRGGNQQWKIIKYKPWKVIKDPTMYEFMNPHTRKCIGLYTYRGHRSLYLKDCGINRETQWRLHQVRRGRFKIISNVSNLVMDIYGNSKHNGARVILFKWHGGNNQHFSKISHGRIQAANSGKCIDIHAGTYIQQWACHRGHNQRWKIVKSKKILDIAQPPAPKPKNGIWEIKNKASGKCIGIFEHKGFITREYKEGRHSLSLQECSKTKGTQWRKETVRRGEVKFVNISNGFVWTVQDDKRNNRSNGALIKRLKWNGKSFQKWRLVHFRGVWLIKSIHSHKCVDIAKGLKNIGATIHQWDCHHGWNQQWIFVVPKLPKREHKVKFSLVNAVNGKLINDISKFKITAKHKNKLYLAKGQTGGFFEIPNMHEGNYDFTINGDSEFLELKDNKDLTKANHDDCKHWTFMISPKMEFKNMRVVLSWSAEPKDLDAIFTVKYDHTNRMEKVSWENMSTRDGLLKLDVDNQEGFGPETITLDSKIFEKSSDINYYVDNYENTRAISGSEAVVQVYYHNRLIKKYKIPTHQMTEQIWHVFRINKGKVEDVNKLKTVMETGLQE